MLRPRNCTNQLLLQTWFASVTSPVDISPLARLVGISASLSFQISVSVSIAERSIPHGQRPSIVCILVITQALRSGSAAPTPVMNTGHAVYLYSGLARGIDDRSCRAVDA